MQDLGWKRVLGVVYLDFDPTMLTEGFHFSTDGDEPNLPLKNLGLMSMINPPKATVLNAVDECRSADIKVHS